MAPGRWDGQGQVLQAFTDTGHWVLSLSPWVIARQPSRMQSVSESCPLPVPSFESLPFWGILSVKGLKKMGQ